MRKDRKVEHLRRQVDKLKASVRDLQNENKVLIEENDALRRINSSNRTAIDSLQNKLEDSRRDYAEHVEKLIAARESYENATKSAHALSAKYKKDMTSLLDMVKK